MLLFPSDILPPVLPCSAVSLLFLLRHSPLPLVHLSRGALRQFGERSGSARRAPRRTDLLANRLLFHVSSLMERAHSSRGRPGLIRLLTSARAPVRQCSRAPRASALGGQARRAARFPSLLSSRHFRRQLNMHARSILSLAVLAGSGASPSPGLSLEPTSADPEPRAQPSHFRPPTSLASSPSATSPPTRPPPWRLRLRSAPPPSRPRATGSAAIPARPGSTRPLPARPTSATSLRRSPAPARSRSSAA